MNIKNMNESIATIHNYMVALKLVKDTYVICSPLKDAWARQDGSKGHFTTVDGVKYVWDNNILEVTPTGHNTPTRFDVDLRDTNNYYRHVMQMDALDNITNTAACIKGYTGCDVTVLSVDKELVAMMIEGEYVAFYPNDYPNWLFMPTPIEALNHYIKTYG